VFYAPKIIKLGPRITKLQSVEKWHVFCDTTICNKFKHFSFSR